jgi:hypothetical protein
MANKIVPFSRSYDGAEGRFSSVELREPTYKEIFIEGRGEPQMWQPGPNGTAVLITLPEVVDSYVQVLAVNPGAESLGRLGTLDALAVKDAVLGFFRAAETSSAQPTLSSSGSAGTP